MKFTRLTILGLGFLLTINLYSQDSAIVKFKKIDNDSDGVITMSEMKSFYKGKKDKDGKPVNGKKLFYGFNHNKNSSISLNEYLRGPNWKLAHENSDKWEHKKKTKKRKTATVNSKTLMKEKKFARVDKNSDGKLTLNEMINFHEGKINKTTNKPIDGEKNFYAHDFDEDGEVTLIEFMGQPNWVRAKQIIAERKIQTGNSEEVAFKSLQKEEVEDDNSEEEIKGQFKKFDVADVDNDFKLSREEFEKIYEDKTSKNGEPINTEIRFYGLDTNDDNSLDLVEFTSKINWEYAKNKYKKKRNKKKND